MEHGDFSGTERFQILQRLGAGPTGVVYRARDLALGREIALKTLQRFDSARLHRFEHEFRALAEMAHPNLVALYELVAERDRPFFTMELVDGVDFRRWLAGSPRGVSPLASDAARLRDAFHQLALAVETLHESGRLHRDIKPSNVMIDRAGRVVLLDSALSSARRGASAGDAIVDPMGGTPAYMAPEQAAGAELGPACDWYSVGAMLYGILAGRLPFEGTIEVLDAKTRRDAPPLRRAGVPEDLAELATALVHRDPYERPNGAEVLRRLRSAAAPAPVVAYPPGPVFIGREAELAALEAAHARARQGTPVIVHVHGPSGIGKTALVDRFVARVRADPRATVLAGRCHPGESGPYKALDGVIDALSHRLRRLGDQAEVLLPHNVHSLVRMFPVLRQAPAVAAAPTASVDVPNPQEVRRRAFGALRELLVRIADRGPLVMWVDDLQWGDSDSAALLGEVVRPPDPPGLLLVASYRGEDPQSACIRALRGAGSAHEIRLGPLPPAEASQLAGTLVPQREAARAGPIARQGAGNPLFISELAEAGAATAVSVEEIILGRVAALHPEARRLLEVIALAGRLIESAAALRASGGEGTSALAVLRSRRLIRPAFLGDHVEPWHERVRETVLGLVDPPQLRQCHAALAAALEWSGRADPAAMAGHLRAAGDLARAGEFAARAARVAAEMLAFDRCAELYRRALEWGQPVQADLAVALSNAGRGCEAAEAFLAAADCGAPSAALDLRRRAAEELLKAGHVREGIATLELVLDAIGEHMAPTPRRATLRLLLRRAALRLRGLSYREHGAAAINPWTLMRIDVCRSASVALSIIDPVQSADFQARHTLLALRAGEPSRIAVALAIEAAHTSYLAGPRALRRAERLMARSRAVADRLPGPYPLAIIELCQGVIDFCQGRWRSAREHSERAARIFRDRCTGVAWEADTAWVFFVASCFYLGDVGELARRQALLLDDARARGDLYAATSMRSAFGNVGWLAAGDVDRARREARLARQQWMTGDFDIQQMLLLLGEAFVERYAGDGAAASARMEAAWPAFERSLLGRVRVVRSQMVQTRGVSALAAAEQQDRSARRPLLKISARAARELASDPIAAFRPTGELLRAGIAALRGQEDRSLRMLESAASEFDALDMALHAEVARRCHAELSGGEGAAARIAAADAWMARQGIRNPRNISRMLAPGFVAR